ncbi:MAG: tyrosinase family protein [Pseudonocardiales bacterium]
MRKNQATLTTAEWETFISAVNGMHGAGVAAPAYREFVGLHVAAMTSMQGMSWQVHTMPNMGMIGRNFLAWHRQFLLLFERRLQHSIPSASLPYWDWLTDRDIPAALSDPALLASWSVARDWNPDLMPDQAEVDAATGKKSYTAFQRTLESVHGAVHNAVGGTMAGPDSPADPLFFLHHANIDRIWARWSGEHPKAQPPHRSTTLQPAQWHGTAFFGMKISTLTDIGALGYQYA